MISLRPYNTFNLNHYCRELHEIRSERDVLDLIPLRQSPLIIGGGSNILLTKDPIVPVLINEIKGKEIVESHDTTAIVKFGAGEIWHEAVMWCIDKDLGGIENLSLIPGKCGAAPIQNIGAYGVELKDVFERLDAIDLETGQKHYFLLEDCNFSYRDSVFKSEEKGRFLILNIYLKLNKSHNHTLNLSYGKIQDEIDRKGIVNPSVKDVAQTIIEIRRSKLPDPDKTPNCGSFFKNPLISLTQFEALQIDFPEIPLYPMSEDKVKVPAGWLIEQCGWKGKKINGVGCHENHALVICNYEALYGRQVMRHALKIIKSVHTKFGIELEPEVNIW